MIKINYGVTQFEKDVQCLAKRIRVDIREKRTKDFRGIHGIPSGGVPLAMALGKELKLPLVYDDKKIDSFVLIVDDIVDSGRTINAHIIKNRNVAALYVKAQSSLLVDYFAHTISQDTWVNYFWEKDNDNIEDSVVRQMEYIGEDPNREGLLETPKRIVKSWDQLYGGYNVDVKSVFKVFADGACDSMVILKDIEFYSTCEHHMLPFFGKAHIAYIPKDKVIGISKLARLLEVYARRMQIQERIGEQVTGALMRHLEPDGAICVLEAQHFCMTSRGVQKQHSKMITSSIKGNFKNNEVRMEFLNLIK